MDEGAEIIKYSGVEILRQELVVLKQVDFTARAGEMVYLMGKVGSGKSSLLKSMYAEVPVEQGSASVLGYDLNKIRRREIPYLRRKIGIVFQDFQLLTDRTISENLEFVLRATGWKDRTDRGRLFQRSCCGSAGVSPAEAGLGGLAGGN